MKLIHTVYKTTNLITKDIYIGVHSSTNPNDEYLGSGLRIKRSIEKYGVENFTKEILFIFKTKEECYLKEREIVTEDFILLDNTYNIKPGGMGSKGLKWTKKQKKARSIITTGIKNPNYGQGHKQAGINNGRHKDNFKGDIEQVRRNISKSMIEKGCSSKEKNNAAKKYYIVDYNNDTYIDLKKGHLREYCSKNGYVYNTLFYSQFNNNCVSKGSAKGLKLFEGNVPNDKK